MKKIALFGASGKTGTIVLQKLLAQGYSVNALVRSPDKISLQHSELQIIKGDVLEPEHVNKTIAGSDVVISLFGHVKGSPKDLQTTGTSHILESMRHWQVHKIISLSGGGLPFYKDEPKFADKLIRTIMKIVVPHVLADAVSHALRLKQSDAKWIIVRAPRLTDDPEKGTYRVGWVGVNASTKISRGDLADFVITQIEDDTFLHQMPFVSY